MTKHQLHQIAAARVKRGYLHQWVNIKRLRVPLDGFIGSRFGFNVYPN